MERFSAHSANSKSELQRRRQREIEDAWGGMSLSDAIASSPPKRDIPSNLTTGQVKYSLQNEGSRGIEIQNGSDIDSQMNKISDSTRLAENLLHNYDHLGENNACEEEVENYLKQMEEVEIAGEEAKEEEKDPDEEYWNGLQRSYNMTHTNTTPAYPRSGVTAPIRAPERRIPNAARAPSSQIPSEDRPIQMNPSGQYNLNFVDWENEWESAFEALELDGNNYLKMNYFLNFPHLYSDIEPDEQFIPGILNRDIQAEYDRIIEDEDEEKQGVKEDIMKKLKVITLNKKKQLSEYETCSICLCNYKFRDKVLKLPCKHDFHHECVKKWFEKNSSCPKCRKDLNK